MPAKKSSRRSARKGGEAIAHACNIGRKEELQGLVNAAIQKWGGIDTLICNAAINPYFGPLLEMADDAWDKVMASNVRSNFWLCNMVLPQMAERGGGSIVIISSVAGPARHGRDRRLRRLQGRRHGAGAQHLRGVGPEEHPRQLHRARPGAHRFRQGALGESEDLRADRADLSAASASASRTRSPAPPCSSPRPRGTFMTGQTIVIDGGGMVGRGG